MKKHLVAVLVMIVMGGLVFGRSLMLGYMSDDFDLLAAIETSSYTYLDAFPAGRGTFFRPMVMLSLASIHKFSGEYQSQVQHLANLFIHVANSSLLYGIVYLLTRRHRLGLLLSLLFLLHPANVTDVYWLSGRTDSLVTFFFLICLLAAIWFFQGGSSFYAILSLIGLTGAMLSKESGISVIAVLWIIYAIVRLIELDQSAVHKVQHHKQYWFLALSVCTGLIYLIYIYRRFYADSPSLPTGGIRSALEVAGSFFLQLVYPNNTTMLVHFYRERPALIAIVVVGIAIGSLALFVWGIRSRSRSFVLFLLSMGITAFLLSPFLLTLSGMSSRLVYLPFTGLCISLSVWVVAYARIEKWLSWLIILLLPFLSFFSYRQGTVWVSNWQLTQEYCQIFRDTVDADLGESQLLFLNWPSDAENTPLFSNDLNGALYHCLYRHFGHFDDFRALLPINAEKIGRIGDIVFHEEIQDNVYQVEFEVPSGVSFFPSTFRPGDAVVVASVSIALERLNSPEGESRILIRIPIEDFTESTMIFAFDGTGFRQLRP